MLSGLLRAAICNVCFIVLTLTFITESYAEIKTDFGATLRLRQEYWDNVLRLKTDNSLNAVQTNPTDRNFFRLRTNVWAKVDFTKDTGAYIRLGNEARYYLGQYRYKIGMNPAQPDKFEPDELFVDNLYLNLIDIFGLPVDLRIGRQDFLGPAGYGDGLLILDGTPGDGSRSFYFDAIKASIKITKNNVIDLVAISNTATERHLPMLHGTDKPAATYYFNKRILNVSNDQAYMLYSKNKFADTLTFDPYYIYKIENYVIPFRTPAGAIIGPEPGDKLRLSTIGLRTTYKLDTWFLKAEYAYQWGEYDSAVATRDGRKRTGQGLNLSLAKKYEAVALKPEFEIGFLYLSGEDNASNLNNTNKHTGWNPLFSRAPTFNEVTVYNQLYETLRDGGAIPAYWTNLKMLNIKVKLAIAQNTGLHLGYQYTMADKKYQAATINPATQAGALSANDTGYFKGHVIPTMLTHRFNKNLDGYLQAE
ncbi:MAG: alginate export family protein, partial [Thermodesulfovibrionales bacterium]|nr:alginate export family protein [Thermodesulfovibrionales bacterium]